MAKINGDQRNFSISPKLKTYALTDVGFVKTPQGSWRYRHPLYFDSPYNPTCELKIDLSRDLKHLTMLITSLNGLVKINIFKNKKNQPLRDSLNFILKDLLNRNILVEVGTK